MFVFFEKLAEKFILKSSHTEPPNSNLDRLPNNAVAR